jgi:hypothetical protein
MIGHPSGDKPLMMDVRQSGSGPLNITWPQARGRYEGTFQPDGTLTGVTFDVQHPSSQATWFGGFDKKFPAA